MSNKSEPSDKIYPIGKDRLIQLILDSIPARIFWKNRDSVYLGCNTLFAQDAGVGAAEKIVGKTDYDLAWKKSEAEFFIKIDRQVMSEGKPEIGLIEPQKHADGQESWIETNKVPLKNDQGEVIGIMGTYNDITERINALDSLKKHASNLEFKNSELEQFAFIASHDLQEPLRTIMNYVELFESENSESLNDDGKVYFKYIKQASRKMKGLISGLLEYARIGRKIKLEQVNCHDLCKTIVKELEQQIRETNCNLTVEVLPIVTASRDELHLIFLHLIENAIKFRKDAVSPIVKVSCKEHENDWLFSVSDNGIGIDEFHKEKVFLIYQRLNSRDAYEGNGIGLTHCKKIIDIFGGKIWFESKLNIGTEFYFTIPKK